MPFKILSRLAALTCLLLAANGALAQDYELQGLTIKHPWARASIGAAKAGVAFMQIENAGAATDRLIAVETEVAKHAALHTHIMDGDIMKMRPVEGGIEIPPKGMAMLKPGGQHVMLMGLKAPLEEGDGMMMKLTFEKAGSIEIMVIVQSPTEMGEDMPKTMEGHKMEETETHSD